MSSSQSTEDKVRYRYTIDLLSGIVATWTSLQTADEVVAAAKRLLEKKGVDVDADQPARKTLEIIQQTCAVFRRVIREGLTENLANRQESARRSLSQLITDWEEEALILERWNREG